jgi:hypothetical protein
MKNWAFFLLFGLLISARADAAFVLAPGVSVTSAHRSQESDRNGKDLVKFQGAPGIALEAEWTFLKESMGINLGLNWRGSEATAQYDYTNPNNPLDAAAVPDLKVNSSTFGAFIGPRFRFVNQKYFKVFAGAGLAPGVLYLTYNENKFVTVTGSTVGFKEKEEQNFKGTYFEAGVELHSTHGGSLRLLGRQARTTTDKFRTLGNHRLNLTTALLSLQYVHVF